MRQLCTNPHKLEIWFLPPFLFDIYSGIADSLKHFLITGELGI